MRRGCCFAALSCSPSEGLVNKYGAYKDGRLGLIIPTVNRTEGLCLRDCRLGCFFLYRIRVLHRDCNWGSFNRYKGLPILAGGLLGIPKTLSTSKSVIISMKPGLSPLNPESKAHGDFRPFHHRALLRKPHQSAHSQPYILEAPKPSTLNPKPH